MTRTKLFPVGANPDGEWLTKYEWVMKSNVAASTRTYTRDKTKVSVPYVIAWAAPDLVWAALDYFWANEIKGEWRITRKWDKLLKNVKGVYGIKR